MSALPVWVGKFGPEYFSFCVGGLTSALLLGSLMIYHLNIVKPEPLAAEERNTG
jgi:hypothetical protein